MEAVTFKKYDPKEHTPEKKWATTGKTPDRERNVVTSLFILPEKMEEINKRLQAKYKTVREHEVRYQLTSTDDAEIVLVAYGLAARICARAVELARQRGIRAGVVRPITLFPYPNNVLRDLSSRVQRFLVVEMNAGQMVEDVRLAVEGKVPVDFYGRMGGMIPPPEEILGEILRVMDGKAGHAGADAGRGAEVTEIMER
jgi:2-oxoglutarate/2-oxoacid ferredoxin oxidoreductase subunit alpha